MLAVVGGLVFAIPWAAQVAAAIGGDLGGRPVLWHELHAIAGVAFALSLLELRRRYRGWFTPSGRIAVALAVGSAAGFALANLGEVLALGAVFVPLYGLSLLALSVALIAVAAATPTLPRPVPVLLVFTGIALPATMALNVVPPPVGTVVVAVALMGYGLLWAVLGFVQLSRTP
jgi:hypothetical protein